MTIPYTKNTTWADGSGGSTPISAAKLNTIETGIYEAHLQPCARVYHSTGQTISSSVTTALAFNSERFDLAGGASSNQHDNSSNNSRLTCRYAGVYLITANVNWSASPSTSNINLRLNGTTHIARQSLVSVDYRYQHISCLQQLAVNDYVEVTVTQTSGSDKDIEATTQISPEFAWVRVG